MKITVKSVKVLSRGKNDYGDWALVKIITDKDIEYTTLHKEAETITPGMVIEIDQLSIEEDKDGREKRSFKKFEAVSKPEAPATNGKPDGMTPELWAEKDAIKQESIERQVIFTGIMGAFTAGKLDGNHLVVKAALDYAMIRLGGQVLAHKEAQKVSPATVGQLPEASDVDLASMVFKDAGALKNYMQNNLGMDGNQIAAATAGCILTTEEGLAGCWASILETREERSEG